jgi:hypothetical protein
MSSSFFVLFSVCIHVFPFSCFPPDEIALIFSRSFQYFRTIPRSNIGYRCYAVLPIVNVLTPFQNSYPTVTFDADPDPDL